MPHGTKCYGAQLSVSTGMIDQNVISNVKTYCTWHGYRQSRAASDADSTEAPASEMGWTTSSCSERVPKHASVLNRTAPGYFTLIDVPAWHEVLRRIIVVFHRHDGPKCHSSDARSPTSDLP